ncbi:MAG: bifunctional phosphoribosylaminoimidazolecarboxamide formyltransferase/IMP cyclohydrolase [Bacteroidota bacterium]|nr:bifunctional phosphoribosylaminoimidazolecarboxamide formyltransferase/IMP cyclohydrolase [Bacteroidota bacterium]
MPSKKEIKNVLISVFDKDGLSPIIHKLSEFSVNIFSTGGTKEFIENEGVNVTAVENLTTFPSILGGRVKTLHPKIFGGILSRRDVTSDEQELQKFDIIKFDLIIVDLYPFEKTVESGANEAEIIEKIDIGGISLIRAAAKNYKDVLVVSEMKLYNELLSILNKGPYSDLSQRKEFAKIAFNVSSHYDSHIFNYFNNNKCDTLKLSVRENKILRYGENPHQSGRFFGNLEKLVSKINGKELSYNNLLDIDSAINLIKEFKETTFAILKHNNACGVSTNPQLLKAWKEALAGDPSSAFGGVLITNKEIDFETSKEINNLFYEVLIAPSFEKDALTLLKKKKNRIILTQNPIDLPEIQFRSALNGVLMQQKDLKTDSNSSMKSVTIKKPTKKEIEDLEFASKICKHTKSNTIVLSKNKQLLASGTGQTSRIDALNQAIEKANKFGFDLRGSVMASDAFFPFPDCVELAHKAGISAVIQPGGSIKDQLSIDYCNENGIAMVMTGTRHFKH